MKQPKILVGALLVSLAVNLFLGGFLARNWSNSSERSVQARTAFQRLKQHQSDSPDGPRDRMGRRPQQGGPEDLRLLRQMVHVMGGQDDPRVVSFREGSHKQIKGVRGQMKKARNRVRAALIHEPFDVAEFQAALSEVRTQSSAAQAGVQESLVTLAGMMTSKEREILGKVPPPPRLEH